MNHPKANSSDSFPHMPKMKDSSQTLDTDFNDRSGVGSYSSHIPQYIEMENVRYHMTTSFL